MNRHFVGLFLWVAFVFAAPLARASAPAPGSPIVFVEIYVSDVVMAKAFYGELLGWQFVATPNYPQMWQFSAAPGGTAGALIEHPGRVNDSWGTILYAHVEKIQESAALAARLGSEVVVPIGVIQGVGSITLIRDLDRNIIGLISDEGR